uniref:Uncharacterized protein n=1 Tax=Arundo donax TaxID=35708 RepID=A0A0A8ZPV3_ARUDO
MVLIYGHGYHFLLPCRRSEHIYIHFSVCIQIFLLIQVVAYLCVLVQHRSMCNREM